MEMSVKEYSLDINQSIETVIAKAKELALYIKRLYYDSQCEYIVLDVQGKAIAPLYRNV